MLTILFIFFIDLTRCIVPQYQIDVLVDIYYALHGSLWNCTWNITAIKSGYLHDNCYVIESTNDSVNANGTIISYEVITGLDFSTYDNNYFGELPSTLFNLNTLQLLFVAGPAVHVNLNESICNLHSLQALGLYDMPYITGSLPDCLFNNTILSSIWIQNTNLSSTLPKSFCTTHPLWYWITIKHNHNLVGSFPICNDQEYNNLTVFEIVNNSQLTGTVPDSFLCASQLTHLAVAYNINMCHKMVPNCWSDNEMLVSLHLNNNNFYGTFPNLNSSELDTLSIANNELEGSVSNIVRNINESMLYLIMMHNNKFSEDDISSLLRKWLLSDAAYWISLYGNKGIKGRLPEFDDRTMINYTTILLLHGCDIHGSIPTNLKFGQFAMVEYITLFNNRLSCQLPDDLVFQFPNYSNYSNGKIVLPGNLFQSAHIFPDWVSDYFISATNMYITEYTIIVSWILFVISFVCMIVVISVKIVTTLIKRTVYVYLYKKKSQFISDIELFVSQFTNPVLLLLIMVLLILYSLKATYFECTPILTWFTLSWFYNQNSSSPYYWLFLIIAVLINIIFCQIVFKLYTIQWSPHKHILPEPLIPRDSADEMQQFRTEHINNSVDIDYNIKLKPNKCLEWIKFIFFLIWYCLGILFIILYVVLESLPDNNELVNSIVYRDAISRGIAFILAFNNSIIVPKLFNSARVCILPQSMNHKKTQIVLYLRTINTLIVPVIASLFLLNDCGKWWTIYWKPCNENQKSQFDIIRHYFMDGFEDEMEQFNVLSSSIICSPVSIFDINWNKCIRSFYYTWTYILIMKYVIMIIMPFILILVKTVKQKILTQFYQYVGTLNTSVEIDSEYAMILSSFESIIAFSIISPLIIPIVLIAMYSSKIAYDIMINKLNWQLTTYTYMSPFPVHLLSIGICFGQVLTMSFFIFSIGNPYIYSFYIVLLFAMDVFYLFKGLKPKS